MDILGRKIDLSLIASATGQQDIYDPFFLQMHRRAIRKTDFGAAGLIKADIRENRVKFISTIDGSVHETIEKAREHLSVTGVTTFARISRNIEEGTPDQRGTGGMRQRLIDLQGALKRNQQFASRLGLSEEDIDSMKFITGTVKTQSGQEAENVLKRLQNAVIVSDEKEANIFQVTVGSGDNLRKLTRPEILELLTIDDGGLINRQELVDALEKGKVGSVFSKLGKRVRGAIGLKGVSLSGEELQESLKFGEILNPRELNEKTIRIFDPETELLQASKNLIQRYKDASSGAIPLKKGEGIFDNIFEGIGSTEKEMAEIKAYYKGSGAEGLIAAALKQEGVLEIADDGTFTFNEKMLAEEEVQKRLQKQFETAYDGSSLINRKYVNKIKAQFKEELNQLIKQTNPSQLQSARIIELKSYIEALNETSFQAITGRVFFTETVAGQSVARLLKTVFDMGTFVPELEDYAVLTTKAAVKRETAIMGQTASLNLTLQAEPRGRVYYDPLAPAFHYDIFSGEDVKRATELRHQRVLKALETSIQTGEIDPTLKRQIRAAASEDIMSPHITPLQRDIAQRNRLFMRQLQDAMDSGVDIRALPQLMNYLATFARANLYRHKDGVYQPVLEGAFRFALNNETVFRGGTVRAGQPSFLGSGFESVEVAQGRKLQFVKFEIQGHRLLFGGNATSIFKQSLGGFDLDDHGIVMPRVFQDASGAKKLGMFIYRQPTGHGEFVFGKASFTNSDTIKGFFAASQNMGDEIFSDYLEELASNNQLNNVERIIFDALNANDYKKVQDIDRNLRTNFTSSQIEDTLISIMEKLEKRGKYKIQEVDLNAGIFAGMKDYASPTALDSPEKIRQLVASGALDEATAARLYNYGQMMRIFVEEGAFQVNEEFDKSIRALLTPEQLKILDEGKALDTNNSINYQKALGKIVKDSDNDLLVKKIELLFEMEQQRLSEISIQKRGSIGIYTNRYTLAASGGNQVDAILEALVKQGDEEFVNQIRSKFITAFAPSDVVDLLVNLGAEGGGDIKFASLSDIAGQAEQLSSIYGENTEAVKAALSRISRDGNIEESVGLEMIRAKAELTAQLRARALYKGLEADLIAGIDPAFLRRASKTDLVLFRDQFLETMMAEQRKLVSENLDASAISKEINIIKASITESKDTESIREALVRVIGMSVDSRYATASGMLQLGQNAKDSFDLATRMISRNSRMAFLSEINISAEASGIAENILSSYKEFVDNNPLAFASSDLEMVDDTLRYKYSLERSQVADRVLASIYAQAESSESATVQDIVDNIQRMIDSRYKKYGSIFRIQNGIFEENELINISYGAQRAREEKFLKRQNISTEAFDIFKELRETYLGKTTEEKAAMLSQSKVYLQNRNMAELASISESHILARTAFVQEFDQETEGKFIKQIGLSEEELAHATRIRRKEYSARALDEAIGEGTDTSIRNILGFGKRSQAVEVSAENIEEAKRAGLIDEDGRMIGGLDDRPKFKRLTEAFKDGSLKEVFQRPHVKKSVFAIGALVAGSVIYNSTKDRGEGEVAGPPLLPGGSAYEYMPERSFQIPEPSMFAGYSQGESYNVSIEGTRDQIGAFTSSASSVARGAVNSTMYRGLPQLGRDPYQEIARSY